MTEYPAKIRFDLARGTPIRKQVLSTAKMMGLTVVPIDDRCFDVYVKSAIEAYNFGANLPMAFVTNVEDEDVEPPRAIRTRAIQLDE